MAECERLEERLPLFVDGELDAEEAEKIDRHLQSCDRCRQSVSFLRSFKGLMKSGLSGQQQDYPDEVHQRLLERLDAATPCDLVQDLLSCYADNELEDEEREQVRCHLSECGECRQSLDFLLSFKGFIKQTVVAEEYPEEVHRRLLAKLDAEKAPSKKSTVVPFRRRAIRWSLGAAATLMVTFLGALQFMGPSPTPTAVADLVDHHQVCWHIAPSDAKRDQFNRWVEAQKGGLMPPQPTVSSELEEFDARDCPAGEMRTAHLLYHHGQTQVSVYVLPAGFEQEAQLTLQQPLAFSHAEHQVRVWKHGHWIYGVVAPLPQTELQRLVGEVQAFVERAMAQRSNPAG